MTNILTVFQREYLSRIKDKWFWITTILVPIGFVVVTLLPVLLSELGGSSQTNLVLVGSEEYVPDEFLPEDTDRITVSTTDQSLEEVKTELQQEDSEITAVADFGSINPETAEYQIRVISDETLSLMAEGTIQSTLTPLIQQIRLQEEQISPQQAARLSSPITPQFERINADDPSAGQAYALAYGIGIIMYFILIFYGTSIMRSVQEEKKNRIVEILLASMRPFELLIGKISGVVAIGMTQVLLWLGFVLLATPGLLYLIGDRAESTGVSVEVVWNQVQEISVTFNLITLIPLFLAYLFFGILSYAGIFSAIAASADSDSDVQSLSGIAIIPIVIGFMTALTIVMNPETGVAFWGSMIPLISPLTMMARLPFGVPGWEIALSLAILALTSLGLIWLSAKIYRVGILLYGERLGWKHIKAIWK